MTVNSIPLVPSFKYTLDIFVQLRLKMSNHMHIIHITHHYSSYDYDVLSSSSFSLLMPVYVYIWVMNGIDMVGLIVMIRVFIS